MPTVGEFYDDLRETARRGLSLEKQWPVWAKQALRFLERNNTFSYMHGTYAYVPLPDTLDFTLAIPRIKSVDEIGYLGGDLGTIPLRKIARVGTGGFGPGDPARFWLEGGTVRLAGRLEESKPLIIRLTAYSDWPQAQAETHPMLEFADDLLKYQILYQQAPALRKVDQMQGWGALRDEALRAALIASDEGEKESEAWMEYRGGSGGLYPNGSEVHISDWGIATLPDVLGIQGLKQVG